MKTLADLLQGLPCEVSGPTQLEIQDVVFDSRQVKPGALFVAIRGTRQDGHAYIDAARRAGAKAVIVDQKHPSNGGTLVRVPDSLEALAHVALRFWDNPSEKLCMVGITGTNGKTTTSYLLESIFRQAGWSAGVMGTINYRYADEETAAPNTTPLASDIQRFLDHILRLGAKACVMEVSSHALALGRVKGIAFDAALFTNLTQDHLDFHKTMDVYAQAKESLFASLEPDSSKPYPRVAVVNADDPWAEKMLAHCRVPVRRYRLEEKADVFTKNLVCDATGSRFDLIDGPSQYPIRLPLLGEYNVMNALAAAAAAKALGINEACIRIGLEKVPGVPGRMERFVSSRGFTVVVDYAHTDDALKKVMGALRKLKPRRLLTVFGCGGDRDRAKRPLMGEAAAHMSDEVIVTSDNPRSEDPARITLDIEVGIRRVRTDHYDIILDREAAIAHAIASAHEGDIVLLAGKGHETYQILGNQTIPFDDREVVKRCLNKGS